VSIIGKWKNLRLRVKLGYLDFKLWRRVRKEGPQPPYPPPTTDEVLAFIEDARQNGTDLTRTTCVGVIEASRCQLSRNLP